MALNLITGYAGIPHVTSENDGAVNAALYGSERYVLNTGQKFAYEIISNNLIRIKDGYAMNQGRKIGLAISEYEDLTIDNGLQGVKRSDIIVIRYTKNLDTGIESADFVVVKGTSGDAYKDPTLETGNIIQGDSVDDLPLYRVKIDGLSIVTVEPMFNVLMSMQEMQDEIASNASAIDSLNSNYLGKRIIGTIEDVTNNILIPDSIDRVFVRVFLQPEKDSSCIEFSFIKVFDDLAGDENILSGFYYSSTYYGSVGITSSGRYLSLDKSWWSFMWNGTKKTASSIYKFKMRVYY